MNDDIKNRKGFRKNKLWKIIIFIFVILAMISILAFALPKLFIRWYDSGTYTESNPVKMVRYLEKRYVIKFPENMREVKAAKSGLSWDGVSSFIVKFTAEPSIVKRFVEGATLHSYYKNGDYRLEPYLTTPEWWTSPIIRGEIGEMFVECKYDKNLDSYIDVYIDTSDEKNYIVYLSGIYTSDID